MNTLEDDDHYNPAPPSAQRPSSVSSASEAPQPGANEETEEPAEAVEAVEPPVEDNPSPGHQAWAEYNEPPSTSSDAVAADAVASENPTIVQPEEITPQIVVTSEDDSLADLVSKPRKSKNSESDSSKSSPPSESGGGNDFVSEGAHQAENIEDGEVAQSSLTLPLPTSNDSSPTAPAVTTRKKQLKVGFSFREEDSNASAFFSPDGANSPDPSGISSRTAASRRSPTVSPYVRSPKTATVSAKFSRYIPYDIVSVMGSSRDTFVSDRSGGTTGLSSRTGGTQLRARNIQSRKAGTLARITTALKQKGIMYDPELERTRRTMGLSLREPETTPRLTRNLRLSGDEVAHFPSNYRMTRMLTTDLLAQKENNYLPPRLSAGEYCYYDDARVSKKVDEKTNNEKFEEHKSGTQKMSAVQFARVQLYRIGGAMNLNTRIRSVLGRWQAEDVQKHLDNNEDDDDDNSTVLTANSYFKTYGSPDIGALDAHRKELKEELDAKLGTDNESVEWEKRNYLRQLLKTTEDYGAYTMFELRQQCCCDDPMEEDLTARKDQITARWSGCGCCLVFFISTIFFPRLGWIGDLLFRS